ncbi:MAG: hypothetical protein JNL39_06620, partial [Opitutaceae bacterium]|nr:hypothetical protein [Opitutaceae bacterium]
MLLAVAASASGYGAEPERLPPSALYRGGLETQIPNHALPAHVVAPEGQLTLFADYAASRAEGVLLYLVNRTGQPVLLPHQDGDLYLKLETPTPDGRWQRAQAHLSSTCGNSYGVLNLPAGQHFILLGYQPSQGRKATVRFSMPHGAPLLSNAGEGLVADTDIADANRDDMARARLPFRTERTFVANWASLQTSWSARVAGLRLIAHWEENGHYRARATELLAEARTEDSPEAKAAAEAIAAILGAPWPRDPNARTFVETCTRALARAPQRGGELAFGSLEANPAMIFAALRGVAEAGRWAAANASLTTGLGLATWQPVIALAVEDTDRGGTGGREILEVAALADELVADAVFERHLASASDELRRIAMEALFRRKRTERLADLARALPLAQQLDVLRLLARQPEIERSALGTSWGRVPHEESAEEAFWLHCFRTSTLGAVRAVRFGSNNTPNPHYPAALRGIVREALGAEAARGCGEGPAFVLEESSLSPEWAGAVAFLSWWRNEEDIPLYQKLLEHRGYTISESHSFGETPEIQVTHYWSVRLAAQEALKSFGIPPDRQIVTKREFPWVPAP